MKSLVRFRFTRFNNTFCLLTIFLGLICLIQIYYKAGIGKIVSSSACKGDSCKLHTIYTTTSKAPAPRIYSYETADVSLGNFTDDTIFVFDAYLLSNNDIQIMTIRKCKNNKPLALQIKYNGTSEIVPVRSYPINSCPWFFAPKKVVICHLVGYFSVASISNKSVINAVRKEQLPHIYIGLSKKTNGKSQRQALQLLQPQRLNVIDVRLRSPVGRHTLAVCLQPIFFFADWTLLIQFFETWITQGATKFYIYVQSMAPEVEELLQAYEADPDIDIERVHWAPLPHDDESAAEPNNYVYRGEVVASVNDCILRARGQAKLVVSSDLDEIVYAHGQPLLSLLETLILKYPKAAAFLFRTRMAEFQNQWANITNPSEINFEMLANITVDKKIWPIGQRSKLIMIPELIGRAHVHNVLSIERGHSMINVDARTGIVLHLRRVHLKGTYADTATYLKPLIPLYNKQWQKRQNLIRKLETTEILKSDQWPNRGLQVLKEIEECRNEMDSLKKVTCISYFKCFGNITAVEPSEWVWADQHWISL